MLLCHHAGVCMWNDNTSEPGRTERFHWECVCVCLVTLAAFIWVRLQIKFILITNVPSLFALIPSFLFSPSVLPARCWCVRAAEFKAAHFEDGVCLHKQGWLLDNYFFSLSLPCTRALFHPDLFGLLIFQAVHAKPKMGSENIPYCCKSSPGKPKCCWSGQRPAKE